MFSEEWERLYQQGQQKSVWPWSDVIALVMKHTNIAKKSNSRVLELGCGAGANIPFFSSLNANYYGLEGSKTSVEDLVKRYPHLSGNIVVEDFTRNIPFDFDFDLILDRASVTHNSTSSIQFTLKNLRKYLKPDGLFIGVDWFSTEFSEYNEGKPLEDEFTRNQFEKGNLAGSGIVHFSNEEHIRDLFQDFTIIYLEHKTVKHVMPDDGWQFAGWNIVVRLNADKYSS